MLIDTNLLRVMKHRKDFNALIDVIPHAAVDEKTVELLKDFGRYFKKFPDHKTVDVDLFLSFLRRWRKNLKEERFLVYQKILTQVKDEAPEDVRQELLATLHEIDLATRLGNLVSAYQQGDVDGPFLEALNMDLDRYRSNAGVKALMWDDTPVELMFSREANEAGVKWRLDSINNCMRPLRPGDFGIIAARPDQGKTTFIASEVTFMAPQLPEDKDVLWFNNEGLAVTIRKRLFQAALGKTVTQLTEIMEAEGERGLLRRYKKRMGRLDRIKVMDCHNMSVHQIEAIIEQSKPGVIIFDMLDNVNGFGGEARTDLVLEELYKWARERAVKYNCIVLATSQISAEGADTQYPTMSMLKDSKTGKQGACDFLLMIGSVEQEHLKEARFISLPKNKLRRDGKPGDPHCEVRFLPHRARYADIDEGS